MRRSIMGTMMLVMSLACGLVLPLASFMIEFSRTITNYPNPFDSRSEFTTILYNLSAESSVKVKIFDLLGNQVREFPVRKEGAGLNSLIWDGTDDTGRKVAKGGYLCAVEIENENIEFVATRKIGVIH